MKKFIVLFSCLIMALSFSSCESAVKTENPIAGKSYVYYYGFDASSHSYYCFGEKGTGFYSINTATVDYIIDFYYTYENKKIMMYKDKKRTDIWATGNYFGSYITIDGEDGEQYVEW